MYVVFGSAVCDSLELIYSLWYARPRSRRSRLPRRWDASVALVDENWNTGILEDFVKRASLIRGRTRLLSALRFDLKIALLLTQSHDYNCTYLFRANYTFMLNCTLKGSR